MLGSGNNDEIDSNNNGDADQRGGQEAEEDLVQMIQSIRERDARDRRTQERVGPWPNPAAVRLNTTHISIDDVIKMMI